MRSVFCGQINEKKIKNKIIYQVKIFDFIVENFKKIEEALLFLKYHSKKIFNLRKFLTLDFLYVDIEKNKHFIVMSRDTIKSDEINVHEESYFEYMLIHPQKFSKCSKQRIINDRNFSFSDILRSIINWPTYFFVFIIAMPIALLISISILLILVLNNVDINENIINSFPKLLNLISIYLLLFIPLFIFIINLLEFSRSNKKLKTTSNDFQEIDWHSWFWRRLFLIIFNILFLIVFLLILIIYKDWKASKYNLQIIIYINCLFLIILLSTFILYLVWIPIRQKQLLNKYYTKNEQKKFYAWQWNKKLSEIRKKNDKIFLFGSQNSLLITSNEIKKTTKIIDLIDNYEFQKIKRDDFKDLKSLQKKYFKKYQGELNDNISKNNK